MLGIDLGAYSVKFCLTKKRGESFELAFLGEKPFVPQVLSGGEVKDKSILAGNLRQFWQRSHLPREVAVSFYHPRMVVQNISLPEMSDDELENALRWEVSSILTREDDFQIDWQALDKKDGQQQFLFAASPSWIVESYLDVFRQACLKVETFEPQVLSLVRGFLSLYPELLDSSFSLVDLGFTKGGIVYFSARKLVFSRYFNWGLNKVWAYLENKFNLLPRDILELFGRGTQGGDIPYQMQEAISETSGDLVAELRRSLSFLQIEFGSNSLLNLFLTGGGGRIVFLRQILVESLPVNIGEISPLVVKKGEFPAEVYLSALGASLWS